MADTPETLTLTLEGGDVTIKLRPDPHCALCGPVATIKDLSAHTDTSGPVCAV